VYEVGTLLAGKYRIDRVLGQGGMGMVVAATHVQLNQPIALKFLLDEVLGQPQIVERFLREARASAALRGEHVCKVSDVGTLENGAPYIVMELLSGRDLSSVVSGNGPLPVVHVADYLLQACLGIAEAHAQGIVHRDLKPANLFLTQRPDGSPLIKVLDFGIAKAQSETNMSLTRTTAVMGSPGYMSPEQLRSSRDVDARSDIWSLGVIMYELVAGRPPFNADSITEMALRVAMDPTPVFGFALPHGFDAVVYHCLEKDPTRRFQDVAQLAYALASYGGPRAGDLASAVARVLHVPAQPVLGATQVATTPTTFSGTSGAVTGIPPKKGKGLAIGLVAAAAIAAGIVVFATRGGAGEPGTATAPSTQPGQPPVTVPLHGATVVAPVTATMPVTPASAATGSATATTAVPAGSAAIASGSGSATPATATADSGSSGSAAATPIAKPVQASPTHPATKPTKPKPTTTKPSSKPTEDFDDSRY
jgi:eukaryotic-like serine/threonine-protein kinase